MKLNVYKEIDSMVLNYKTEKLREINMAQNHQL